MTEMISSWLIWASRVTGLARMRRPVHRSNYYEGPEVPIGDIESHLLHFTGGSVDLQKFNDGIATLCLNNYQKRNAMSGTMMVDLRRAVQDLESWAPGRGLLVFGAGGTFCSGGDLQMARATANAADGFKMAAYMHDTLDRFQRLPLLTVAVIEGTGALGGGAELALACDWRVAAEGAHGIGMVHARMGVAPAFGGARRLLRLLGRARALDVLSRAEVIPPEEALSLGLIDAILPKSALPPPSPVAVAQTRDEEEPEADGEALAQPTADADGEYETLRAARLWLQRRLRAPPEVLRALKAMCDAELDERRLFAPLWGGDAQMEALRKRLRHVS